MQIKGFKVTVASFVYKNLNNFQGFIGDLSS